MMRHKHLLALLQGVPPFPNPD
jgi:predicted RNA methylase